MGEAKLLQKLSDIARMKLDAEPLGDDSLEVDPPPAHDAVDMTIRAGFDDLGELSQLLRRKARLGTLRPVVDEAVRTRGVEAMDPVTQRLPVHAPDLRCGASAHPVLDPSQDRNRRLWLTFFDRRANPRSASAE
jgi:hypothetical protein